LSFVDLAPVLPEKLVQLPQRSDAGSAQLEDNAEESSGIDAGTGNGNRELVVVVRNGRIA